MSRQTLLLSSDGLDLIAMLDECSGEIVYFTRGLGIAPSVGDVLAETHINGSLTQTYLYVSNHRGDTVALLDAATGEIVAHYEYDAWGNVVSHSGQHAYFTYSSKHFDENAGLYYYGYRWYDPVAKRWTQPDPSGLSEGLDLYCFCGNEPLDTVDAYGLWKCVGVTTGGRLSEAGRRKLYQYEQGDTAQGLADLVGLDVNEIHKWMKLEKCPKDSPWTVSVPNVWIAADLLRGWDASGNWYDDILQYPWDKVVNMGGTIGMLVGTDLLTRPSGFLVVTPKTPLELKEALLVYQGDVWGMTVFAHGNPIGINIYSSSGSAVNSEDIREVVKANGYKLSKIYMMQCYSNRGQFSIKDCAYVKYKGYNGMNAALIDLDGLFE
jgi:RHS repeat-associated protein